MHREVYLLQASRHVCKTRSNSKSPGVSREPEVAVLVYSGAVGATACVINTGISTLYLLQVYIFFHRQRQMATQTCAEKFFLT